jgi:sterol desaturase/sphingolipid hydroxylase (fatty acid hydroxylase superfamily)
MFFLGLAAGFFVSLGVLERRRPLRARVDRRPERRRDNVALSLVTAAVVSVVDSPLTGALARRADARGRGPLLALPAPLALVLGVLALDYALYLWHVALHRVPWLWRAHLVHHTDLDLDVSTGLRFHASEMVASALWRAALVRALGIGERPLAVYQRLLLLSVLFHHSNLRLPADLERRLALVLVTPRLHGIHHSTRRAETDSNWSSLLTAWDRLHGTLRLDVPQEEITSGVPGYAAPLGLRELAALPVAARDDGWTSA